MKVSVPFALAFGVYSMAVPPFTIEAEPLAGDDDRADTSGSPSGSLSLARTSIVTAPLSSATVTLSAAATGAPFPPPPAVGGSTRIALFASTMPQPYQFG